MNGLMIIDPTGVFVVLAAVVLVSVWLETKHTLFRSLGAALVAILLGMVLSNIGMLPDESPTYEFLMGPGISVGIALILLSVDVKSIMQAGPAMLAAFAIGSVGTALGALVGAVALSGAIGSETWKLAGQYTGTYTGGGVNFAALGRALGTSSDMFTAATAADVIMTAVWMAACLIVPVLLGRKPTVEESEPQGDDAKPVTLEQSLHSSVRAVPLSHTAALVMIAVGATWVSELLGTNIPFMPSVLWLTTIILLLAQVPAIKGLVGSALWGNYLLLLFLASNGARSVVANIVTVGPAVFYFALITVAIHGVIIFGLGMLVRIDPATLAVASQANVGGAGSAMALAGARGYTEQLLPGVAVSLLGYAVGNYTGYAVASLARVLVGA